MESQAVIGLKEPIVKAETRPITIRRRINLSRPDHFSITVFFFPIGCLRVIMPTAVSRQQERIKEEKVRENPKSYKMYQMKVPRPEPKRKDKPILSAVLIIGKK